MLSSRELEDGQRNPTTSAFRVGPFHVAKIGSLIQAAELQKDRMRTKSSEHRRFVRKCGVKKVLPKKKCCAKKERSPLGLRLTFATELGPDERRLSSAYRSCPSCPSAASRWLRVRDVSRLVHTGLAVGIPGVVPRTWSSLSSWFVPSGPCPFARCRSSRRRLFRLRRMRGRGSRRNPASSVLAVPPHGAPPGQSAGHQSADRQCVGRHSDLVSGLRPFGPDWSRSERSLPAISAGLALVRIHSARRPSSSCLHYRGPAACHPAFVPPAGSAPSAGARHGAFPLADFPTRSVFVSLRLHLAFCPLFPLP